MKNKKLILVVTLCYFLIMLPLVSSFFPTTHKFIHDKVLETPIDSTFYNACASNSKLCFAGNILSDVSVIFYFTERGKYTATHSPSFCRSLLENVESQEDLVCAVGGCMHQPHDIVSHTDMVPNTITHSGLVNNIIHTFAEQKLDNWVVRNNPFVKDEALTDLNSFETCVPLFKKALIGEPEYSDLSEAEIDGAFETFISEVQQSKTGYDPSFEKKSFFVTIQSVPFVILGIYILFMAGFLLLSVLLLLKVIKGDRRVRIWIGLIIFIPIFLILAYVFIGAFQGKAFAYFTNIISPLSELAPIGGTQTYIDQAVRNTQEFLTQGEIWLTAKDASGFQSLDRADDSVKIIDYIILFVLLSSLTWFIWILFKRNKPKGGKGFSYEL